MACSHFFQIGSVHVAEFQAELDQQLRRDAEHAAIDRLRKNGVVARAQQAEDGINRRHAGSEDVGRVAALQLRDGALQRLSVRVVRAGVVVALALAHLFDHVGRGLVNRRDD